MTGHQAPGVSRWQRIWHRSLASWAFLAVTMTMLAGAWLAAQSTPDIEPPAGGSFYGLTPQFSVSPDGQQVVFVATANNGATTLWMRPVGSGAARPLAGTEQASYPFWSPDSTSIGYFASGKLLRIPAAGGAPVVVCDAPTGRGGTWNAEGTIVFTSGITDPLRKVSANGGQPVAATTLDAPREGSHRWPQFLPDGRHILFWAGAGSSPAQLKIASLDSADTIAVAPADTNASYGGGYIYYGRANALMALPFDAATRQKTGEPRRVAELVSNDAGSSYASLSASRAGTLLYTPGTARGFALTWFDRRGRKLRTLGTPGQYTNAHISRDGKRVAVSLTAGAPANRDIWLLADGSGAASRITTDPGVDATPIWSSDGTALIFSSQRSGPYQIYRKAVDGSASEELLFKSEVAAIATDWSRDGRFVAYTRGTAATGFDVWIAPVNGAGQPMAFASGPGAEDSGVFSPDGRWMAYQSNESGRNEIYVRRFTAQPPATAAIRVSRDGGTQPLWRADGKEMFFFALDGAVMAVNVTAAAEAFRVDTPRRMFGMPVSLVIRRSFDVTPDGQRFLIPTFDDSVKQTIAVAPPLPPAPAAAQPATAPAEFLQTFDSMQDVDAAWTKSSWANTNRAHSPDNVTVNNGILELKLSATAPGAKPVCAEVASRRRDFFYGTYRASIKMSNVPGGVVGWFTYLGNPLNEIDVEFLTRDPRKAHFTLHHIRTSVDSARPLPEMPFDPSEAFHEYRFDWYKDRVEYYVDGTPYATLTKEVPDMSSRLMLNHWSGNNPGWGGPAPTEDAVMLVDWVYYSSEYKAPAITR